MLNNNILKTTIQTTSNKTKCQGMSWGLTSSIQIWSPGTLTLTPRLLTWVTPPWRLTKPTSKCWLKSNSKKTIVHCNSPWVLWVVDRKVVLVISQAQEAASLVSLTSSCSKRVEELLKLRILQESMLPVSKTNSCPKSFIKTADRITTSIIRSLSMSRSNSSSCSRSLPNKLDLNKS